ncbi:hypothetical protein ACT2VT_000856 [Pantoea agglomerans]
MTHLASVAEISLRHIHSNCNMRMKRVSDASASFALHVMLSLYMSHDGQASVSDVADTAWLAANNRKLYASFFIAGFTLSNYSRTDYQV